MKESNKPYIVTNPQIEEMAEVIATTEKIAKDAHCGLPSPRMYATDLYRKGWRKQSKGEWISLEPEIGLFACSLCDHRIIRSKCNFCPNCGAKMKGE